MKRYMLFQFDSYYPCGGANDFVADFGTLEEAKLHVESVLPDEANIFDTENSEIVAAWSSGEYRRTRKGWRL